MSATPVATHNASFFGFLRRRLAFVESHAADGIEAYVIWGAATDALSRIHARRVQRPFKGNRVCFTSALHALLPQYALDRVSIPLLAHELDVAGGSTALTKAPFTTYLTAERTSRIWRTEEDPPLQTIAAFATSKQEQRLFESNRYSDLLYEEYRCCAVHGLELGRKTFASPDRTGGPGYMNYLYSPGDSRPIEHRFRTRLTFPLQYLGALLRDAIDAEERLANSANFTIPDYPTLDD